MEANTFIANLKASGSDKDLCDLGKCFNEFIEILNNLTDKNKASFSLNVLCILCRNLEKVPEWRNKINTKELLTLSIECLRHTRALEKAEQVKILACTFHIHRHVVVKNSSSPPELVLKLSYMPFEYDNLDLLNEYCKTYGHIIIDRITYIEKLKSLKISISKLLPKLMEDVVKVTKIYDTVQFCTNMLTFLVKKVYYIYNESPKDVNKSLGMIFDCLSNNDLKKLKNLSEKEALDLYVKINECLYTVIENSLKTNINNSVLDSVTRVALNLLGHKSDMFHCFQTFYLNSFCCIFSDKSTPLLIENVLHSFVNSCEMTEKLGYMCTINATYPFMSQLLRLYIEHNVNTKSDNLNETIQENCLKCIVFLLEKLQTTNQLTKCENCNIKSGLHDALRLSFSIKHFITISMNQNINLTNILPVYFNVVEQQYTILEKLKHLKCSNSERCFRKQQTDIHNIAVLLNKQKHYEYSIKLFEIYLRNELKNIKNDTELRNISRALYNKSICELDFKLYQKSLLNAYLSLIFSLPEGLSTEKYMSLVIDVKAKALKSLTSEVSDGDNDLQPLSVLQACALLYNDDSYGNLKMYLKNLKFSSLLKHEFSMYVKLWPSIVPISGVWRSLLNLIMEKNLWLEGEDKEILLRTLFEVVLETPTVVRNIHDDCYKTVVSELVKHFENTLEISIGKKLIYGTILLLNSEYNIAEASHTYHWKVTEYSTDPDQDRTTRTIKQEHEAIGSAVKAVDLFTDVVQEFDSGVLPNAMLRHITQILCVSVQQLMHFGRVACALQLAHTTCRIADVVRDKESYIHNASVLIYHSENSKEMDDIIKRAVKYASEFIKSGQSMDAALSLLCDVAIYYIKRESISVARKLIQSVQAYLLSAYEKEPEINLDLSLGRLMEAQAMLCPDSGLSTLSAINGVHRHYLTVRNIGTRWTSRRLTALRIKNSISDHGWSSVRLSRRLLLWRRATSAAAAALPSSAAARRATVFADTTNAHCADQAMVKIDTRLRYILDLTPPADTLQYDTMTSKPEEIAPKQDNLETMLDCMTEKDHISPTRQYLPHPPYRTPDFLKHANTCTCYACSLPTCAVIACQIAHLEASTYYRSKEYRTARTYFDGALKSFSLAEEKLLTIFDRYKMRKFNNTVVTIAKNLIENQFKTVKLEFLIELTYFELSRNEFEKSNDHVVAIQETLSDLKTIDPYLRNEVSNLIVATAHLRKPKDLKLTGLEIDMEELKLSPNAIQKTPETKTMPKINTIRIVNEEELPKKFKAIKLDLDKHDDKHTDTETKPRDKRFKLEVLKPVTSKPVLENATPIPTRSRPRIVKTVPSIEQSDSNLDGSETECEKNKRLLFKVPAIDTDSTNQRKNRSKPHKKLTKPFINLSDSDLDLDEVERIDTKDAEKKQFKFKVPTVDPKSILEKTTPRMTRSTPNIVLTQPSDESDSDVELKMATRNETKESKRIQSKFKVPDSKSILEKSTSKTTRSKPNISTKSDIHQSDSDLDSGKEDEHDNTKLKDATKKQSNFKLPNTLENTAPRKSRSKTQTIPRKSHIDQSDSDLDIDKENEGDNTEINSKFKVPTSNLATPKVIQSKPNIDQSKLDINTPKSVPNLEFFTPFNSTPEQFFTPISSMKTYSKRNVVRNLDSELSTPKSEIKHRNGPKSRVVEESKTNNENKLKEFKSDEKSGRKSRSKVETGSMKTLRDNRLKRATSPGKLVEATGPVSRSRRLKQPE